jgi:hypothetical protein
MDKEKYFNMFKNYKTMCSNKVSDIVSYDSWSDEFCRSELKEIYVKLIKAFKDIDFAQFTIEELKTFDFQMWNDDVILMPIWALDCLKDGTKLVSISGGEIIFNKERGLDKDTISGCTAYGFNKSQLRDSKLDNILQ